MHAVDLELGQAASARRAAAIKVARELATEDDLPTLLGIAQHGLGLLFGGDCTVQLAVGDETGPEPGLQWLPTEGLRAEVISGLAGPPSEELAGERGGILLLPYSASGVCRAWVHFDSPRRVSVDELIVGDLFAQAFAIAVDRVVSLDAAARREVQLRQALDAHRLIGQATGIMMERHRLSPARAFDLLRVASQTRNIKLRELAGRVVETGEEPHLA